MGKNVKHSSNSLRRTKGSTVKRKQQRFKKFKKGKLSMNSRVQGVWDQNLTLRQNYEQLGLAGGELNKVNNYSVRKTPISKHHNDTKAEKPLLEWKPTGSNPDGGHREQGLMSEEEQLYVAPLVAKHGTNYKVGIEPYYIHAQPFMLTSAGHDEGY